MSIDFRPLILPVPGDRVKCGLRTDLPKKQRRHEWLSLGIDLRRQGDGTIAEFEVFACLECGTDKQKRPVNGD